MRRKFWITLLGLGLLPSFSLALVLAQPPFIPHTDSSGDGLIMDVVSSGPNGLPANGNSYWSSLSSDGQLIVFSSDASDLVAGDTNGVMDIFIHDRTADTITRISVATDGSEANGISQWASLSADGRFVTFYSEATNLVPGLTGVFLHDRQTGATSHIAAGGTPVISADGGFIAFHSDANNLVPGDTNGKPDIFVFDRQSAEITRVSVTSDGGQANGYSVVPHISANGRFVAFTSSAIDLVPGDTRAYWDVFIHDRLTAETRLVSRDSEGDQQRGVSWLWGLSPDGRYVAYTTGQTADSMPALWIHDRQTRTSRCLSCTLDTFRNTKHTSFSADSRYIVFDRIGVLTLPGLDADVYAYDLLKEEMRLVALSRSGLTESRSFAPAISGDGSLIAFSSADTGLAAGINPDVVQIMVASNPVLSDPPPSTATPTATLTRTSTPTPTASATSTPTPTATVLTSHPEIMELISVDPNGTPGTSTSIFASLSADGRYVAFSSLASNLVPGDTNGYRDIFVRDRLTGTTTRASIASDGTQGNHHSGSEFQGPSISADGRFVTFYSQATNLVPNGIAGVVYVHDRQTGETSQVARGYNPVISADGRFIAFASSVALVPEDTNNVIDIFVFDRQSELITRVSVGSDGRQSRNWSGDPRISADGRFVIFTSNSDLIPNAGLSHSNVFLHDRLTAETSLVSIEPDGSHRFLYTTLNISADGRYVSFEKDDGRSPEELLIRDLQTGQTRCLSCLYIYNDYYALRRGGFSADGRYYTFENSRDVYVYDLVTEEIRLVSVAFTGITQSHSYEAAISADGRFITFSSRDTGLVPITFGYAQLLVASNPFLNSAPIITPTPTPSPTPTATETPSATPTPSPTPTPALADVPALIEPADAMLLSANRPLFRWAASLGAVRYQLRLDTIDPPAAIVYEGPGTRYTPPTPLIVGTFFWQVRALDGSGGSSDWSPVRSLTIQSAANAAPSLNYFTTSTPTLTWGRVSQAIAYEIQVDNERSFAAPLAFSQVVDGSTFDATITPALPDGIYFWRVRAQSANGQWRPWSAIDSFIVDVP